MAERQRPASRKPPPDLAERILERALETAEDRGWDEVRLRCLADDLGVTLAEVQGCYRDLDAVADAWFQRAWTAILAPPPEGFAELPAKERLFLLMMRWFDALAPYRRVTGEMLAAKLYPSHPHHWVPTIFNLSRTIQWLRDAASLDAGGRRRQAEEVGLTALFLATLAGWVRDASPDQEHTRETLRRRLENSDRLMARLYPSSRDVARPAAAPGKAGGQAGRRRPAKA